MLFYADRWWTNVSLYLFITHEAAKTHTNKHTKLDTLPQSATHTHTHTRLTALFPGLARWAGTRKVKPIWILLKQDTVSGSGISWAIGKSAPRSRQTTMPAPHRSVFYRPDALPAAQPTVSKHWRQMPQSANRKVQTFLNFFLLFFHVFEFLTF